MQWCSDGTHSLDQRGTASQQWGLVQLEAGLDGELVLHRHDFCLSENEFQTQSFDLRHNKLKNVGLWLKIIVCLELQTAGSIKKKLKK